MQPLRAQCRGININEVDHKPLHVDPEVQQAARHSLSQPQHLGENRVTTPAVRTCCLDEELEPTCFERSDDIGGIWRFTEHVEDGRPSLYKSVVSNTCKEMSAFTDFPYPEDFPVFLSNSQVLEYLRMYAKQFGLLKHSQFKMKLPADGGTSSGTETFQGKYFHSRHYKHPDVSEGKRVLVIGMGNSGVDITVEASRVAKKRCDTGACAE
ncbi:unnamed protein product [Caretta caretta]